jgi:ABC-2 type transport system permease protein
LPNSKALPRPGLVTDTLRSHRLGIGIWIAGGSLAMYAIAAGFASEVARFAGGAKAMAASMAAGVEAMRLLRWPAERLDTLGGYLTYHNITLYVLFLSLYAAIAGAHAVRGPETRHSLEEILAAGWSRSAVIRDRTAGFALTLLLISAGVGMGLGISMAAGGQPNLGGSIITAAAAGLCALAAYAFGLLISQLMAGPRAADGITGAVIVAVYLFTNVWQELGPAGWARFISPFYYFNTSRALVPGHGFDLPAAAALLAMTVLLIGAAAWAFQRRDYAAPLWSRRAGPSRARDAGLVQRPVLRAFWSATLFRERYGLLAWASAAALSMVMMARLEPSVVDMWNKVKLVQKFIGTQPGRSATDQYLSFAAEILAPIVVTYVITRAAAWVADLRQGRVELILAGPVSWSRLIGERLAALDLGVLVITAGSIAGLMLGAASAGAALSGPGLLRVTAITVLLGTALGAVAAVAVARLPSGLAVTVLVVFAAASYLLTYLVQLFGWPGWVSKLSVFGAFGRPYLELPTAAGFAVLAGLAMGGTLLAVVAAQRSPKTA